MIKLQRYNGNPILSPNKENLWEHDGAFNGCVVKNDNVYHMVYRALSSQMDHRGHSMKVSTIGYAESRDGFTFGDHKQVIKPTEEWEKFGCEDPRITFFEGQYYIFYTVLSDFPFTAGGIKLGLAKTRDFQTFEKFPVTTFNSKAMALFPERIDGKMAAILTPNTDQPPAKISIAIFNNEEEIRSPAFWNEWYKNLNSHIVPLLRQPNDQVELGAQPVKTNDGWLVIYSYIKNYMSDNKFFGIEAVLLDGTNPKKVIGRTDEPLLLPEAEYELHGEIANIAFPSGAIIEDDTLKVYYGAADTRTCVATCSISGLLNDIRPEKRSVQVNFNEADYKFVRFSGNPILSPIPELSWQAAGVFNPAAIYEQEKTHIIYRAQSMDLTSTFGYATNKDGFTIDENLPDPIYVPREDFEKKPHDFGNSGCEDPRISRIGDRYFMLYTAYNGVSSARVAITSISVDDFLNRHWNWDKPKLISLPDTDDKDACVVGGKTPNTYLWFHRLGDSIWLEITDHMNFGEDNYMTGTVLMYPRKDKWDNLKLGISGPPIETDEGWLLLYHGVTSPSSFYRIGAVLLDYQNPAKILARIDDPIFEPVEKYELVGQIPNVVFPCGSVVIDGLLYSYYGGADKVIGVATIPVKNLLKKLLGR